MAPQSSSKKESSKKSKISSNGHGPSSTLNNNNNNHLPEDYTLVQTSKTKSPLDWNAIANDSDIELCLFRYPTNFKPKNIDSVRFPTASKSNSKKDKDVLGSFKASKSDWEIVSMPSNDNSAGKHYESSNGVVEELGKLVALLPQQSNNNKLLLAPKPITHRYVIRQKFNLTQPKSKMETDTAPPPKHEQPEQLSGFFKPFGFETQLSTSLSSSSSSSTSSNSSSPSQSKSPSKSSSSKKKKRSAEDSSESPKKRKKES